MKPALDGVAAAPGILAEGRQPLLFQRYPGLASVAFLPLLHGPTPVEAAPILERQAGRSGLWVKRDDLTSPVFGGNKVRKYEFVLGEAAALGKRHLLTVGGLASTQVTATAALAKALGFRFTAVLFDQPLTDFTQQAVFANQTLGAAMIYGGSYVRTAWELAKARVAYDPAETYLIGMGASSPRPNLGYVDAALELAEQIRAGDAEQPAAIFLPSGTGGTAAALALGFGLAGLDIEVVGVTISTRLSANRFAGGSLAKWTYRFMQRREPSLRGKPLPRLNLSYDHSALGPGYGEPTPEAENAAQWLKPIAGEAGEITYTGKGLEAFVRASRAKYRGKPLLYWNTLYHGCPDTSGADWQALGPRLAKKLRSLNVA